MSKDDRPLDSKDVIEQANVHQMLAACSRVLLEASVHNDMQRVLGHLRGPSGLTRMISQDIQDHMDKYRELMDKPKSYRMENCKDV